MTWRAWLKTERLIPSVTILVAFAAEILGLFGVVQLNLGESILLLLLGLLAGDALWERVTILEQIRSDVLALNLREHKLSDILQNRTALPSLEERFRNAKSIDIVGMSLLAIATSHQELLGRKAKEGCQIRLVLLNPENAELMRSTCVFISPQDAETQRQEILTSLKTLLNDPQLLPTKQVEIRLLDYPLAHGYLITNGELPDGEMRVEMYMFGKRPIRTPGISVKKSVEPGLFETFYTEYRDIWQKAKPISK